eukprot:scpid77700/ scgid11956/ 
MMSHSELRHSRPGPRGGNIGAHWRAHSRRGILCVPCIHECQAAPTYTSPWSQLKKTSVGAKPASAAAARSLLHTLVADPSVHTMVASVKVSQRHVLATLDKPLVCQSHAGRPLGVLCRVKQQVKITF